VVGLSLNAVDALAQVVRDLLQVLVDLAVGRHTLREGETAAPAEELVVDVPGRVERVLEVVAHFVVGDRALDIRPHVRVRLLR
jgi:hypothetical protein